MVQMSGGLVGWQEQLGWWDVELVEGGIGDGRIRRMPDSFTYFNTCATVFGPNHSPIDFPSPTPICAVFMWKNNKQVSKPQTPIFLHK